MAFHTMAMAPIQKYTPTPHILNCGGMNFLTSASYTKRPYGYEARTFRIELIIIDGRK